MNIHERIKEARTKKNLTLAELGNLIGVSAQAVQGWEDASTPRGEARIRKIAEVLGVTPEWLQFGSGLKPSLPESAKMVVWEKEEDLNPDEFVMVRYYPDIEFAAGVGMHEQVDYNDFQLPFSHRQLNQRGIYNNDKVFCVRVKGDSMEPRLPHGSDIGVDQAHSQIIDGNIYAFRHDDLIRIKYLHRLPGGKVLIKSENKSYPDEEASLADITIIGRVFWVSQML